MINGQKVSFFVRDVHQYYRLLKNWYIKFIDWENEAVDKAEILRLIYQGRFLHCNVTLGALGLPLGKTTVMHLVPRDNLPEPNSQGLSIFNFNTLSLIIANFVRKIRALWSI